MVDGGRCRPRLFEPFGRGGGGNEGDVYWEEAERCEEAGEGEDADGGYEGVAIAASLVDLDL